MLAGDLQGFPNGRRLTDDVLDIELQALEGAAQTGKLVDALAAGDKVDRNDNAFGATFPYVALPNGIAVNQQSSVSGSGGYAMNTAMLISAGGAALIGGGAWFAMWWRRSRRRAVLAHSHGTAGSQHVHSGEGHDGHDHSHDE